MTHNNARLQSAVIIVSDPDQDSKILNIPADANGRTFTLDLTRGNTQLGRPRKIQMDDLPSATRITLASRQLNSDGTPQWWMRLKTTHQTSKLDNHDVDYFVNGYLANDFIKEGLGIVVDAKTENNITRDTLGKVTVDTSPVPPTH